VNLQAYQKGRGTLMRKPLAILFWVISALASLGGGFMVWVLKDGLGPGLVESHGIVALYRFGSGMATVFGIFALPPLLVGCLLYPWRKRGA